MTTFINCTRHKVTILDGDQILFELPANESAARVVDQAVEQERIETAYGPIRHVVLHETGELTSLPEPEPDTLFVVSQRFARTVPERRDLVFPFEVEYDDSVTPPRVIGCHALGSVPPVDNGAPT